MLISLWQVDTKIQCCNVIRKKQTNIIEIEIKRRAHGNTSTYKHMIANENADVIIIIYVLEQDIDLVITKNQAIPE